MTEAMLSVCCPYCSLEFETGKPNRTGKKGVNNPWQIESLPYTRDIGRFDPKTTKERTDPSGWSEVCKDFMTFLGFERIGILRREPGSIVDVMYRVQYCPGCKRLFDVFANYTPRRSLAAIWPHLFRQEVEDSGEIRRYMGISWPIWIVETAARRLHLPKVEYSTFLLGLLVFMMSLLPWLFREGSVQPGQETRSLWMTLVIYAVASVGIGSLLLLLVRFVRKLQASDDFYDLFETNSRRGISYWYNYTICRFVGVQHEGKLPQISQVEVWGSGLALLSMLLVWVISHARQFNILTAIGAVLAFAAVIFIARHILRMHPRRTVISITVAVLLLSAVLLLTSNDRQGTLLLFVEVIFWSIFAYIVGMAAWVAMSATLYVLKGLTRLPMRINPLSQFKELKPLLDIQRFSTNVMAVLFVMLVSLVFLLEIFSDVLPHLTWMIYWLQLALAALFTAIAVGLSPVFLLVTAAYAALTIFFYYDPTVVSAWNMNFDLIRVNLVVFGGFLTFIMYFHLHQSRSFVNNIIANEKDRMLAEIDNQILKIREYGALVTREGFLSKDKNLFFEYTQGLHGLDALLNLRKTIQAAQFRSANFAARVISPLLWSIVLPSVWDILVQAFLELWT